MSHEIRTPLNAIVGLSEDMESRNNCPEDMREDLHDIVSASRTLLEIVGNIMDISKIESNKLEINEMNYNLKEEVETLARVNATRIGDKQLELKVNIAEDIPYELIGDKAHIKEIINNLLSNAIKYTEKGTVDLNVRCINQNKLFNKFERLDVEKNTTIEGTGLGLAITKKLVDLMGGKINVESQYGKGSMFVVQIPQKIGSETKKEEDIEVLTPMQKKINYSDKKVLIVDDNKLNIKVARRSLEPLGFGSIDECYNGQECIDKINSGKKYDIILMDIMMPQMSGETAIKELQKDSYFNTPVIALTADTIEGAFEKYKNEGFYDYISKPFSKEQISELMSRVFADITTEENDEVPKYNPNENRFKDAPTYVIGDENIK